MKTEELFNQFNRTQTFEPIKPPRSVSAGVMELNEKLLSEWNPNLDDREGLAIWAELCRGEIIRDNELSLDEVAALSPQPLPQNPEDHERVFLSLFEPADRIGFRQERPARKKGNHSIEMVAALNGLILGMFVMPSTFWPGVRQTAIRTVRVHRYVILTHMGVPPIEFLSIANWVSQFLRARAIVDCGSGKLEVWMECPPPHRFYPIREIVTRFGCERFGFDSLYHATVPGRLLESGVSRLLWLDPPSPQDFAEVEQIQIFLPLV